MIRYQSLIKCLNSAVKDSSVAFRTWSDSHSLLILISDEPEVLWACPNRNSKKLNLWTEHSVFNSIIDMSKCEFIGRCHCGEIQFSFFSEPITEGRRCNCSFCIRRGAVMSAVYIPAADFHPSNNIAHLNKYSWNDRVVDALFCSTCGVFPYFGNAEFGYRVNLGCVEGVDALALKIEIIDGKNSALAENPGPHPGSKQVG